MFRCVNNWFVEDPGITAPNFPGVNVNEQSGIICVKNTVVNSLDTTKTMTGTASDASQTTDNNAITANQLDSDNSNTTQLNNNSLRYGESPLLEEFSFISSVLFNRTVLTLMISLHLNQYILYSAKDRSYSRIAKIE